MLSCLEIAPGRLMVASMMIRSRMAQQVSRAVQRRIVRLVDVVGRPLCWISRAWAWLLDHRRRRQRRLTLRCLLDGGSQFAASKSDSNAELTPSVGVELLEDATIHSCCLCRLCNLPVATCCVLEPFLDLLLCPIVQIVLRALIDDLHVLRRSRPLVI